MITGISDFSPDIPLSIVDFAVFSPFAVQVGSLVILFDLMNPSHYIILNVENNNDCREMSREELWGIPGQVITD